MFEGLVNATKGKLSKRVWPSFFQTFKSSPVKPEYSINIRVAFLRKS